MSVPACRIHSLTCPNPYPHKNTHLSSSPASIKSKNSGCALVKSSLTIERTALHSHVFVEDAGVPFKTMRYFAVRGQGCVKVLHTAQLQQSSFSRVQSDVIELVFENIAESLVLNYSGCCSCQDAAKKLRSAKFYCCMSSLTLMTMTCHQPDMLNCEKQPSKNLQIFLHSQPRRTDIPPVTGILRMIVHWSGGKLNLNL